MGNNMFFGLTCGQLQGMQEDVFFVKVVFCTFTVGAEAFVYI